MKFEQVHNNKDRMLLQCISGSKAYGLNTPQSDTDIKGIFYYTEKELYGLEYTGQVANESNDLVYYEIKRLIELLVLANPNLLELLCTPEDCILYRHPVIDLIRPEVFLSKLCFQTFAGYAQTQVKKAGGLNKKIFNPIAKERKSIIDFCYILFGYHALPLQGWLDKNRFTQESCGLVKIPHAREVYALYHQSQLKSGKAEGITSGIHANDVKLTSVEAGIEPLAIISFNKDGYSSYCKDYKEYWEWVEKRNDARYQNTLQQGKNYDAKNMMHTFRLLNMASEIATEQQINVRRSDRAFLLKIRNGEFHYEELMVMADEKMHLLEEQFAKSDLPELPDETAANQILIDIRYALYNK